MKKIALAVIVLLLLFALVKYLVPIVNHAQTTNVHLLSSLNNPGDSLG